MREDAPQREHSLREVFNGLRYIVRTGMQWRMMPNDLPPWYTVYQQTQRWLKAGVFEDVVRDLRMLIREINDRMQQPRAAILDRRTLQSSPESGGRAGYDGHKRRKGSKVHLAVDTLGQLLAIMVTPANEQDRHKSTNWPDRSKKQLATQWRSRLSTKATLATSQLLPPRPTVSAWKSSSCLRPSVASRCCPVVG
jgi:transposase